MGDDLTRKQPEDPTKVNLSQAWEVRYWTEKLGVSEKVLRKAQRACGPSVKKIKKWLRENGY